jgi:CheY-like chemotaxis protein
MSTDEIDLDLDFTKCFAVPASLRVAAAARPVTPPPPPPPPAPVVAAPPVALEAAPPGNLVCYARAGAGRPAAAKDASVLVVEDHEPSRRMLEKMLQLQGFTVRVAADSRECARELRKPPLPRLILLDVGLPRVSGFQILAHLRQHPQTSAIPVVMVTACTGDKDIARGLSLGVEGYLSKPIAVKALQSIIGTVLWKQ